MDFPKNGSRQIEMILSEISSENGIVMRSFSDGWIFSLSGNHRTMFIHGYKFPCNNAGIDRICDDKAALSEVLSAYEIPHIPHYYFMSPNDSSFVGDRGSWKGMMDLLKKFGNVVCKPNEGNSGKNVLKVRHQKELKLAAQQIFKSSRGLSISPFRLIQSEYRVIVVYGRAFLIYEKERPFVVGNGTDSLKELIARSQFREIDKIEDLDLDKVIPSGDKVTVGWKHNLEQGAVPSIVSDPVIVRELTDLAMRAVLSLGLEFASIDIIRSECGLEILEINSGVMMENFSESCAENYAKAKEIYTHAVLHYLRMDC